jgi:hypothetical protein
MGRIGLAQSPAAQHTLSFQREFAAEKLHLLERLERSHVRTAADTRRLHSCLCFIRAFPDSTAILVRARSELANFHKRVQKLRATQKSRLAESGIAGTMLHYPFSYEVASWIARNFPGTASIDWRASRTRTIDELLNHVACETDCPAVPCTGKWLSTQKDFAERFDWLMAQLAARPARGFLGALRCQPYR